MQQPVLAILRTQINTTTPQTDIISTNKRERERAGVFQGNGAEGKFVFFKDKGFQERFKRTDRKRKSADIWTFLSEIDGRFVCIII